jgi:site-specific recombinase XerD
MRYHQLRHRFGTAVYAETRDLLLTQRLMRHSNPSTTAGYAAVADSGTDVVASLPGAS